MFYLAFFRLSFYHSLWFRCLKLWMLMPEFLYENIFFLFVFLVVFSIFMLKGWICCLTGLIYFPNFFFCEWQVYENMEVKKRVALSNPYGNWIKENLRSLKSENFLSSSVMENDAVLRHQQWEFYVDFALGLYPWWGNFCFKVLPF